MRITRLVPSPHCFPHTPRNVLALQSAMLLLSVFFGLHSVEIGLKAPLIYDSTMFFMTKMNTFKIRNHQKAGLVILNLFKEVCREHSTHHTHTCTRTQTCICAHTCAHINSPYAYRLLYIRSALPWNERLIFPSYFSVTGFCC